MSILYIQLFAASSNPMMEMVSSDTSMEEDNIDISTLQPSFDTVDLEELRLRKVFTTMGMSVKML